MMFDSPAAHAFENRPQPGVWNRVRARAILRPIQVAICALIVFAVGFQQNYRVMTETPYHPDESRWLNRAEYTRALLHPFSSAWEDRYLTRGQPPGGSYITGIGLLLQGRDLDTNLAWNFERGDEKNTWWNTSRGAMPNRADLIAARRTSVALGAVTAAALFLIVFQITNLFGGLIAGLFFALHPLSIYLSTLGVSDAAFTTIAALTTLAGMSFARSPNWPRALLLGVMLGAGAATKLSPLFLAIALGAGGAVLVFVPIARRIPGVSRFVAWIPGLDSERSARMAWKLLAIPAITGLTFVLSYPFLWPAPLARTRSLFDFRRYEMDNQARIWPQSSVDSRIEALQRTWDNLETRFSTTGRLSGEAFELFGQTARARGFDVPIALVGLALLLVLAWRRGIASPTLFALALAGGQAALIVGGLRVDFNRYYLPIVLLFAIGTGVAAGCAWSLVTNLIHRRTADSLGVDQRARLHARAEGRLDELSSAG